MGKSGPSPFSLDWGDSGEADLLMVYAPLVSPVLRLCGPEGALGLFLSWPVW